MPLENVEFKAELPDALYKEVMAFANTYDGTIYIGVDNQGDITGIGICDTIQPDVTLPNMNSVNEAKGSAQSLQSIHEIRPQMRTVMDYLKQYDGMRAHDLQKTTERKANQSLSVSTANEWNRID